jgi:general stress protein YciG
MDRTKQREIASKGGKAAHQKGTAHEWTSEEAREAGRKGGMASHRRKQQQDSQQPGDGDIGGSVGSDLDRSSEMGANSMMGSEAGAAPAMDVNDDQAR